jgi:hypothetical protein
MRGRIACLIVFLGACSSPIEPTTTGEPDALIEADSEATEETSEPDDTGSVDSSTAEDSGRPDTYAPPDTAIADTGTAPDTKPIDTGVDTGPKDTGPPACNAVTPGYYVTLDARRENVPSFLTWSGGVIPDGVYELKTYVEYNGPSGVGTYLSGGKSGEAIKVTGKVWERSFRPAGGYPNRYENYDAELVDNTWKLVKTCGTTTTYTPKFKQQYSVTTTGFTLFAGGDTTGSVSTYVKK